MSLHQIDLSRAAPGVELRRAATIARGWGIATIGVGIFVSAPLAIALLTRHTIFGPGHIVYFLASFVAFVLPGLLYFVFSNCLPRRASWAPIAGIVVASVQAVFAVIAIGGAAYALRKVGPFMLLPMIVATVLLSGAIQVIRSWSRAMTHLHEIA